MMSLSNLLCLICQVNVDISSSVNIFSTSFPRHGESLVNFVSKVLRTAISELQDSYICLQCYNLFKMLEEAERTVFNIRCEILKIYRATDRANYVQKPANADAKQNLKDIILKEKKSSKRDESLSGNTNLELIKFKETPQHCIQENELNQIINITSINSTISREIAVETIKDIDKVTTVCNEINNIKSFSSIDINKDINAATILENNSIHPSIALTKGNVFKINAANDSHALKLHFDTQNLVPIIDSKANELKDIKMNVAFSENEIHMPNNNFKWGVLNESFMEINKNANNATVTTVDQLKMPIRPKKSLKRDLKSVKYICSMCQKRCKTATELRTHVKTHSTLRPYMCEKCGQAYKHKHALEIHVGMHNGINPFQCNFCQKCFTQKGALMRHLPMHTGEMPYQCELCGKRFIHHTSYNMHRLSHSGKKSYKCHMCDLSLLSTSHLKRHMRVHTGEKPYSCTLCGKRFAERYNLLAHQKIHDPLEGKLKENEETRYQCNHCNLVFKRKEKLSEHMKQHSNANNQSNLEKSQCVVLQLEPDTSELPQTIDSEHNALQQTWIQMNNSKLDITDNEAKFVLLQNSLPEINENSFMVTFGDQKVFLGNGNYNTNLQVIIEPSDATLLRNDVSSIEKMHM